MRQFEVISLDMFQTLVNVNSRIEHIWKPILHNKYTMELAEENAQLLLKYFFKHWSELRKSNHFYLMHEVYRRSFADVFTEKEIIFDCDKAVGILFQEHKVSHYYDEVLSFLERISKIYKVCIVSDADDAMIPRFYQKFNLHLFTSEQYQSYKSDEKNVMFKELLKIYGVRPNQVLHIGDSTSDIIGANREGIITCWINRENQKWEHEVKPDYIIKSLNEIEEILKKAS